MPEAKIIPNDAVLRVPYHESLVLRVQTMERYDLKLTLFWVANRTIYIEDSDEYLPLLLQLCRLLFRLGKVTLKNLIVCKLFKNVLVLGDNGGHFDHFSLFINEKFLGILNLD